MTYAAVMIWCVGIRIYSKYDSTRLIELLKEYRCVWKLKSKKYIHRSAKLTAYSLYLRNEFAETGKPFINISE